MMKPFFIFTGVLFLLSLIFLPSAQTQSNNQIFGVIDDSYEVSAAGAYNHIIPIQVPPGVNGLQPNLALVYDSRSGVSELGLGWALTGISKITRSGNNIAQHGRVSGISFTAQDSFLLDGQYLSCYEGCDVGNQQFSSGSQARYRTENESFSVIRSTEKLNRTESSPESFVVKNPNGLTQFYGLTERSRRKLDLSGSRSEILDWYISKIQDTFGNYIDFTYEPSPDNSIRIASIKYTGNLGKSISPQSQVSFEYYDTSVVQGTTNFAYLSGVPIENNNRLKKISVNTNGDPKKKYYHLIYDKNKLKIKEIKESSDQDGNSSLPSTKIHWQSPQKIDYSSIFYSRTRFRNKLGVIPSSGVVNYALTYNTRHIDLDNDGDEDAVVFSGECNIDKSFRITADFYENNKNKYELVGSSYFDNLNLDKCIENDQRLEYIVSADINGDSRPDFISENNSLISKPIIYESGREEISYSKIETGNPGVIKLDQGPLIGTIPKVYFPTIVDLTKLESITEKFDIDGDNKDEFIVIPRKKYNEEDKNLLRIYQFRDNKFELRERGPVAPSSKIKIADLNSDGIEEVVFLADSKIFFTSEEESHLRLKEWNYPSSNPNPNQLNFTDFNGDGYTDLYYKETANKIKVWLNDGIKFSNEPIELNLKPEDAKTIINFGNFTNSGYLQAIEVKNDNSYKVYDLIVSRRKINPSEVKNEIKVVETSTPELVLPLDLQQNLFSMMEKSQIDFEDIDFDGVLEIIFDGVLEITKDPYENRFIYKSTTPIQDKVIGVTDGFGNKVQIEYSGLKDPNVYTSTNRTLAANYRKYWGAYPLVKSIKYSNGINDAGTNTINYKYSDLIVETTGRGLSGFCLTSKVDDSNGITIETEYDYEFPKTGKIISEKRSTKTGIVFFEQKNEWNVKYFYEGIDQDESQSQFLTNIDKSKEIINEVEKRLNLTSEKAKSDFRKEKNFQTIINIASKLQNRNLVVNYNIIAKDNPQLSTQGKFDNPISTFKAIPSINRSRFTYLPVLKKSEVVKRELDNKITSSSSIRYEFDSFGNIRKTETEFSDGSQVINKKEFSNQKDDLSDNGVYLIGLPESEETIAIGKNGVKSQPRTIHNEFNPNGSLKKKIRQKVNPNVNLSTEYFYDGFGNITETRLYKDSNNVISDKTIYTDDGRFPKEKINALDFKTTFEFDKFYGNLLKETDPNGISQIRSYDAFGNLRKETQLNHQGTEVIQEVQYDFSFLGDNKRENALYQLKINQSGAKEVVQYYDKMGREIGSIYSSIDLPQTKTEFVQVGNQNKQVNKTFERKVESQVWFDSRGNVVTAMKPRYFQSVKVETQGIYTLDGLRQCTALESSENYFTKFEHDDFDRVTKSVLPDGKFVETKYEANKTTEFDLQGKSKTTFYNQKSEIIRVVDEKKNAITYEYDLWGNVTKINSPNGTSIQTEYDELGRKIKLIDPNLGTVKYEYDEFDRLIKETTTGSNDQKKSVSLEYDKLGRLIKKTTEEGVSTWTYDTEKKGKVSEIIDTNGYKKQLKYDDLARPVSIVHTVNNIPYETKLTYDDLSRLETKTFSSGYIIGYEYENNVPVSVTEIKKNGDQVTKKTIARINSLTADGLIVNKSYGNGLISNYKYKPENNLLESIETQKGNPESFQPVETSCPTLLTEEQIRNLEFNRVIVPNRPGTVPYNPGWIDPIKDPLRYKQYLSKKFDEIKAISSTDKDASNISGKIQDLKFEYDSGYNIASKTDLINQKIESYTYDNLDRLDEVVNYENKKTVDLEYNEKTGNISSKSDKGTYEYDIKSPQRVKFITKSGNVAHKFNYDDFGNLIEDSIEGLRIKYSTFNKPTEISKNNLIQTVKYGSENEELQSSLTENSLEKRISLKPFQDFEVITENGVQTTLHYISLGGELVAIHTKTNQISFNQYIHKDRLGSIQVITDERATPIAKFDYTSFGEKETLPVDNPSESQISSSKKGFTSHEHLDEFGLINASGRYFMPGVGRFVSADPFVQSPSNLQSLNRYSYVENDPLNSVDPSGFIKIRGPKVGKVKDWGRNIGREVSRGVRNSGRTISEAGRDIYNEGDRFADKYGEQIVIIAAAAAITVATGGVGAGAAFALAVAKGAIVSVAINAAVITYHGGNFQDIMNSSMNAAVNGAASAAAFYATGEGLKSFDVGKEFGSSGYAVRVGSHATVGGITTEVAGGNFKDGMISASITQAFSPLIEDKAVFGTSPDYKFHRIAFAGAIGGTAAYFSGGNVFMGTTTGVFSRWFNDEKHLKILKEIREMESAQIARMEQSTAKTIKEVGAFWHRSRYDFQATHELVLDHLLPNPVSDILTLILPEPACVNPQNPACI